MDTGKQLLLLEDLEKFLDLSDIKFECAALLSQEVVDIL